MLRVSIPNALPAIEATRLKILAFLGEDRLTERFRYRLELVLEETLMNRLMHAFPRDAHRETELVVDDTTAGVVLCFEDDGVPFDPRQVTRSSNLDDPGGWGLLLTRAAASDWEYRRVDGRNRFVVRLSRTEAASQSNVDATRPLDARAAPS